MKSPLTALPAVEVSTSSSGTASRMPWVSVGVGVGVGDADGDGDAVGAADPEDVPEAGAEACGVPDPGLTVVSCMVTEGVGWPFAGAAGRPGDGDAPAAPGVPPAPWPAFAKVEAWARWAPS